MPSRLPRFSLVTAALLLSLFSPLYPTPHLLLPAAAQTTQDRKSEVDRLELLGIQQYQKGQLRESLATFQQVLGIRREIKDRAVEGTTLSNIGLVYDSLGQYPKALEFYQQALAIRKQVGDRAGEGTTLNSIGAVYHSLGQYPKALEFFQQALAIRKQVGDRAGEDTTLNNIGVVYQSLGQYPKALEFFQQALAIRKQVGDRSIEGRTLNNIGLVYNSLGQYPKALEFFQQALAIIKQVGDRAGEGITLNNIGGVYFNLGQYPKALEFFQQALAIRKQVGDRPIEGTTLSNIGLVYDSLGQYPKALEFYQQALAIRKQVGDRAGEGITLNNIGLVYDNLGQYPKALEFFQQALAIIKQVGGRAGEGTTLNNIGLVYRKLGQYPKALEFFQQALAIIKQVGDLAGEGRTLNNIGYLLDVQKQPGLAIIFFKQSVNVREAIRQDLRKLSLEEQKSYTETVASTYRRLADLLLQQDRILEAQQVLDLLKVQELQDYLRNIRGNDRTAQGTDYQRPEQDFIKLGKELADLQQRDAAGKLDTQQQQRLAQLVQNEKDANKQFNAFIESPEVQKLVRALTYETRQQNINLEDLNRLRDTLKQLDNAVLFYPLILEDRLELILTTPYAPPIRRTVKVKREELNEAIFAFRSDLNDPGSNDVHKSSQKLYEWLIKPFEAELQQANAKAIIYAPDATLRYIPLAALYDGKQWLVEKYRINNITARSLTDFNTKSQAQTRVLAGAFGGTSSEKRFGFSGLPATVAEVETIATAMPNTLKLISNNFTLAATEAKMGSHSIVHLATHAQFVSGSADDSFILFGNGDKASLPAIKDWSLNNVDLVILSACQTGVGDKLGNGAEILGLGYQFQRAGARATIATLWKVSDGGTQVLMDAFYAKLKQGKISKAETLRQAQIALIQSQATIDNNKISHPYYWSAFILIGNGL